MLAILILAYTSMVTTIIVALFVYFNKYRIFDSGSSIFRVYFFIAAAVDILLFILQSMKIHNIAVMNLFSLAQFLLIALALNQWMKNELLKKTIRIFSLIAFSVLTVKILINIELKDFDTFSLAVENIILVICSSIVMINLTGDTRQYLFKNYRFWITLAVFIYFSVSTVVFATGNLLIDDHVYVRRYTWVINSIMSIVANSLYLKGILCLPIKKN
ncbi:MAG TPA: hypothetical protein PKD91_10030 [Bacteroidia bacterium]|nr:hypothetical protein [Bacteroidia bacterium]